ncbi:MAG TPA: HAD family hydrolase [Polyangiaceae bacterium]|nr:HAD family hydrolase [Polyangiaceae bacterium]
MLQAILFDYDDTLVQTKECKFAALRAIAQRHYALTLSDEVIREHWGVAYEQLFRALFGAVEADVARVIARYEAVNDEFPIAPYPEVLGVLRRLRQRVAIGIVTSAGRALAARQLERIGLAPSELSVFQGADDTPLHKPDPRVFEPALAVLAARNISRDAVLYVGDSLRDFAAARGAGLDFIGVLRGTTTPREFEAAGARYCRDLEALIPLLGLS